MSTKFAPISEDLWVDVAWMPHSSLSQSSHVTVRIQSAHLTYDNPCSEFPVFEEWRVQISVRGLAAVELVPLETSTTASPLTPRCMPIRSPSVGSCTHECVWNQTLVAPIRWRDLPRDSYLQMKIVRQGDFELFEASLPLFDAYGKLETGLIKLDMAKCGIERTELTRDPGMQPPRRNADLQAKGDDEVWRASQILDKLDSFCSKNGVTPSQPAFHQVQSVPWLDALTRQHCEKILLAAGQKKSEQSTADESPVLVVSLPTFDVPVMHEETCYTLPTHGACGGIKPLDLANARKSRGISRELVPFLDYESAEDNAVEEKYRALAHDLLRGLVDPALKPDKEQRDRLATIIASPSHHLTREEEDLLWRFRFSLVDNRRALTKFLVAVDWTVESETVQAAELLEEWRKRSPIEVTDALKLLGKHVAFQTNLVRTYALDTLAAAPDDELRLYLLQLVQAIKYESTIANDGMVQSGNGPMASLPTEGSKSSLASFLIERAAKNIELANYLYWYLKVELQDPTFGVRYKEVMLALQDRLSATPMKEVRIRGTEGSSLMAIVGSVSKIHPSRHEGDNESILESSRTVWDVLRAQDEFISGLMDVQMRSRDSRGKRDAKETRLRDLLATEGYDRKLSGKPVPLPPAPHIRVDGIVSQSAKMFKSALYPALLEFRVSSCSQAAEESDFGPDVSSRADHPIEPAKFKHRPSIGNMTRYKLLVKTGDDLRQDQLIIMMIQLMDGLLKRGSLDLCLTPYGVIATSNSAGLVEFVERSIPISQVLATYGNSIMSFFQSCSPKKDAKYGVQPDAISNYIRSCAGYCVITYLLGVGDRHLDNIMLQPSGHFFHIDFGFIFGRDPKPLPPPFRLTREMVEGMGGPESPEYRQFCSLACQAYNTLRKSAGLVLNLLSLMSDAGIEDLSNNPSADTEAVIASVEERFRLDLDDEQAERFFVGLINDSLTAIAPRVMEVFHSIAVARR